MIVSRVSEWIPAVNGSLIFGECRGEIERDVHLPTPSRQVDPPHNHYFDETIK